MPSIKLKSGGKIIKSMMIHENSPLTIGESPDNHLVIDDPAVSGHHAEIEAESGLFYITDRQSRNGTFVNEELIISRALTHNDIITVGGHLLLFAYVEGEKIPSDSEILSSRMTMTLDTHQHRSKLVRNISRLADDAPDPKERVPVLSYMDGSDGIFPLESFPVRIGKGSENHIQVKGVFMGKTAAVINHTDEEFRLTPTEGFVKPKVNFHVVKHEVVLKEFDVIEIGSLKLQFHFQSADSPGVPEHE